MGKASYVCILVAIVYLACVTSQRCYGKNQWDGVLWILLTPGRKVGNKHADK